MSETRPVLQLPTDATYRSAKTLIRTARFGALAVLDPADGAPLASRVGVSTDIDGTPVVLISRLAAHTAAILADPRCSLLLGEPGKGDPLAHPRLSLRCRAVEIGRPGPAHDRIAARYLAHQPKAGLYAELGDFRFFRLEPVSASLNAGFGKAYELEGAGLLTPSPANDELAAAEMSALAHMNEDHFDAIGHYARHYARAPAGRWTLAGVDAEGIDIVAGEDVRRVWFDSPLGSSHDLHATLVAMARAARQALEKTAEDPA